MGACQRANQNCNLSRIRNDVHPALVHSFEIVQTMKPKILVVDDEPDAVELIEFNLKAAGFDVVSAEDGQTALNKARSTQPNLILLDIMT